MFVVGATRRRRRPEEVVVVEGVVGGDAGGGGVEEHEVEEIQGGGFGVELEEGAVEAQGVPLGEDGFEVGEARDAGPRGLVGRAEDAEDSEQLVDFGIAREERATRSHFSEDAADGPEVDRRGVVLAAEQDLGGAVPERDDFVGVGALARGREGAGEAEVGEFEGAVATIEEEILRLEVSVEDASLVAIRDAAEHLEEKAHGLRRLQAAPRLPARRVHVMLEILVQELEGQVQLGVRVHDVVQRHDVRVRELLQQRNLPDRRRRHALLLVRKPDLLQRQDLLRPHVPHFVHHPVRPLPHLLHLLVLVHFGCSRLVVASSSVRRILESPALERRVRQVLLSRGRVHLSLVNEEL
mmetsp:Transcript_25471/g.78404  ORF Transcript_25471/g.78404 Transcript_25471/m.78404 type:complete len:353 (-) Transcript_25471:83-1141(-)